MKLIFVLSLMFCGVLLVAGEAPWKGIRRNLKNRIGDGPLDLMLMLDASSRTNHNGFNRGQRGCKIWTRLLEKITQIGAFPDYSRVGLVELGYSPTEMTKIQLGQYATLDSNLNAITALVYPENPQATTFEVGLNRANDQFDTPDRKRMIVFASDRKTDNPEDAITKATLLKNAGVLICTAAIGENSDKSTLKDISGNAAGQKCYESYRDWDQYIYRMTKVKDNY